MATLPPADLILSSARLWDGSALDAEAIAIADGRILATGSNREVAALAGEETQTMDVTGRRVIPGMIDSHIHMVRAGRTWTEEVRWDGVASLEEGLELISQRAGDIDTDRWVAVVGGWHPHQFVEDRAPTRHDLDRVAPDHPAFLQRNYVEAVANSRALEEMEWRTDGDGHVTNPAAMAALRSRLDVGDHETQIAGTRDLLRELNRLGLTGAIDAAGFAMTAAAYGPYLELWQRGERGFRTRLLVGAAAAGSELEEIRAWDEHISPEFGDDYLRYLGMGEVLLYAVHDMEGLAPKDISGQVGPLADLSRILLEHGRTIHHHAILDSSIRRVLDAWEQAAGAARLAELRLAICHADQAGEETLRRVRDLGLGLTIQAGMAFRGVDSAPTWSGDQLAHSPRLRTMLEMGIPVGAGSDGTVAASYNPWRCIAWMVTGETVDGSPRRSQEQLLTIDEALRLYTSGSAWFSFEEDTRGNLRPGSHADLAVLSKDPLTVADHELAAIESTLTIVGGQVVHQDQSPR